MNRLRDYFGRERREREKAESPAAAAEKNLPKFIPSIWGVVHLDDNGNPIPDWVVQERREKARQARIDNQVLAAMRCLDCPADLAAIWLVHWLNTDSSNYPPYFYRSELRASLARLAASGRVFEITRFWGLRKKWVAGNLLELLAKAAAGRFGG